MKSIDDVLQSLYEWAVGHITQAELAERLSAYKVAGKTLQEHKEHGSKKETEKEAKDHGK